MKFKRETPNIYFIVENGLIADTHWGEGRLIPILVLKSKVDNQLGELLKVHKNISTGDIITQWGKFLPKLCEEEKIFLQATFLKPQKKVFQIEFKVNTEYTLINAIFKSKGVYFGTREKGDKILQKLEEGKSNNIILVEVGNTDLDDWWDKKLNKILYKKMKKKGIPRKYRKEAAKDCISEMDRILNYRMEI